MTADFRDSVLFSALTDKQLQLIKEGSCALTLKEGESLFETGEMARRFYFLASGQIKLFRLSADGAEKVIDIVYPGQTFAEALMFLERPVFPVCSTALLASRVISFDNAQYLKILRESVDSCFKVMGNMSLRLRGLIKEIDDLTLQDATTRLCGMLWRQMEHQGESSLELRVPKGVLASRLSIKPETFSRILNNLCCQGVIGVNKASIQLKDRAKLREMAHPESMIGLID